MEDVHVMGLRIWAEAAKAAARNIKNEKSRSFMSVGAGGPYGYRLVGGNVVVIDWDLRSDGGGGRRREAEVSEGAGGRS